MNQDHYLKPAQAAAIMGCTTAWLYVLTGRGEIPSYKAGGRRLFKSSDVHAYIEQRDTPVAVEACSSAT